MKPKRQSSRPDHRTGRAAEPLRSQNRRPGLVLPIDLAVDGVEQNGSSAKVRIKNIGGFAAPVNIILKYEDGTTETLHQTPAIWSGDQTNAVVSVQPKQKIVALTLDGGIFMDANPADNVWKAQ